MSTIRHSSSGPGGCPAGARTPVRLRVERRVVGTSPSRGCWTSRLRCPNTTTRGRALPRRRRHPDRFSGRHPGMGRRMAVRVQPQPRQPVPARQAGLLQYGQRPAQSGRGASQHLSVFARRHAARAAQRGDRHDARRLGSTSRPNSASGPAWHWAAWVTRVGTLVVEDSAQALPHDVVLPLGWASQAGDSAEAGAPQAADPYKMADEQLVRLLRQRGILSASNPTDPGRRVFQSETGQITIDATRDTMTLDTPRTAGGFAPAGEGIRTTHGVDISVRETDATVWVSSLDDQPITGSRRLLVTHLTDLQNTEIRYAERRGRHCSLGASCHTWSAPARRRSACNWPTPKPTRCGHSRPAVAGWLRCRCVRPAGNWTLRQTSQRSETTAPCSAMKSYVRSGSRRSEAH